MHELIQYAEFVQCVVDLMYSLLYNKFTTIRKTGAWILL